MITIFKNCRNTEEFRITYYIITIFLIGLFHKYNYLILFLVSDFGLKEQTFCEERFEKRTTEYSTDCIQVQILIFIADKLPQRDIIYTINI